MERVRATVDLAAIEHNVTRLRQVAGDAELTVVVKADGYGHGMIPVARAARAAGAGHLGVALPTEAIALRDSGDTGPVLAWLYTPDDDLKPCVDAGVELSASDEATLGRVVAAATGGTRVPRVHLKVDTGLGRNGCPPHLWPALVESARNRQRRGELEVVGVWSHLACAEELTSAVTAEQAAAFGRALQVATASGLDPQHVHLANSAGTLAHPDLRHTMVRCGIAAYGLSPGAAVSATEHGLIPAMTVSAGVALTKDVPTGHGVSYGHRYHTTRPARLALIPVGYADGIPRAGSGKLPVFVPGVGTFPIAGTVAMDQFVLDVGGSAVRTGDQVLLFGPGRDGEATADDWAKTCGTINYEIVTRIGPRVPRVHVAT